jgi:hypothetical protein
MKQLVKPRFIGRMSNNFFQIAAAIGYAKKYNVGWGIKKGYIERGFNANQVDRFIPHLPACNSYFKPYTEWQDKWTGFEFNYHEIPFFPNGVEIVGFWQSEKYFKHAADEVRQAINISYQNGYTDYCSVHIRRGDYVNLDTNFPPVTPYYVELAMKHFGSSQKYLVFSDDIEWCKKNLSGNLQFSEGKNEWEDLCLMASCGHNIIANSSFSWWAGWLNKNPDKVVVTPSHKAGQWFGPDNGNKNDCIDLIPEGWKEIEFRQWEKINDKWHDANKEKGR